MQETHERLTTEAAREYVPGHPALGVQAQGFRKFRKTDTAPMFRSTDTAPRWLLSAISIVLTVTVASATEKGEIRFRTSKSFSSEVAYAKNRRPALEVVGSRARFVAKNGDVLATLDLARDREGFDHRLIRSDGGAVVVRSTSGYEWGSYELQSYSPEGRALGRITSASGMFSISKSGSLIAISRPSDSIQFHFSGQVAIYSSSGSLVAEIPTPECGPIAPQTVFSDQGDVGAILFVGQRGPSGRTAGVLIFSGMGKVLGRFESPVWAPMSKDLQNPRGSVFSPIARVDEVNGLVLAEGGELGESYRSRRAIYAVGFDGSFRWRWYHDADPAACTSTIILQPKSHAAAVLDFCGQDIRVTKLDVASGAVIASQDSRLEIGKVESLRADLSADERRVLVNLVSEMPGGGSRNMGALFDESWKLRWHETFDPIAGGDVRFDQESSVVVRRGSKVYVGSFSE